MNRGATKPVIPGALLTFLCFLSNYATLASNAAELWQHVAVRSARHSNLAPPMVSRALAVLHTCTYGAWAAYDDKAVGTQLGGALRRPPDERTEANKERAISYAAYRALTDLFPRDTESVYKPLMRKFGYDPDNNSMDIETPEGIGNVACAAVLEFRHHDKSNQLGDLAPNENRDFAHGPYSDWTNFHPSNRPLPIPVEGPIPAPGSVLDPSHWQPLSYVDSRGNFVSQMFTTAHWCFVTPFALNPSSSSQSPTECPYTEHFRSLLAPGPAKFGDPEYEAQAKDLVDLAAHLTDRQKILAEYWTVAPEASRSTHANTSSDWHRDIMARHTAPLTPGATEIFGTHCRASGRLTQYAICGKLKVHTVCFALRGSVRREIRRIDPAGATRLEPAPAKDKKPNGPKVRAEFLHHRAH